MMSDLHGLNSSSSSVKKIRNICSSLFIEHLHDDLLLAILCRLPSKSVFLCKCVSRRWCFLISNPRFVVSFLNRKIREQTIETVAPPGWTFMLRVMEKNREIDARTALPKRIFFTSDDWKSAFEKFILEFNSRGMEVAATFKDLVLCYDTNQANGQLFFHICNPLTTNWVALPPSHVLHHSEEMIRAGLICEEPYDYDRDTGVITKYCNTDYKFRVVVANSSKNGNFDLMVFCSETRQWKQITLVISITNAGHQNYTRDPSFQVGVWNKMLYLGHKSNVIGVFDPFDITATTSDGAAVAAKILPPVGSERGTLVESEGQLFKIDVNGRVGLHMREYKSAENDIPEKWEFTSLLVFGDKYPFSVVPPNCFFQLVGVHPRNMNFIYLRQRGQIENQFVLCDMGTRRIKLLNFPLWRGTLLSAHRIEFQWWPTPVPAMLSSD